MGLKGNLKTRISLAMVLLFVFSLALPMMPTGEMAQPAGGINDNNEPQSTFNITLSAEPEEGGTVTGEGGYYYGETADVEALFNPGFEFVGWTENGLEVSTDAEYTFEVEKDRELVANFDVTQIGPPGSGDVTGGGVDVSDVIEVLKAIVGLADLTEQQEKAADVNQDGEIDIFDAIIILRYIIGLIDSLPVVDEETETGEMQIHFIDVGQGDAVLIEAPTGEYVLVDGGPRSAGDELVSYLKTLDVDTLAKVVATHQHEDHIGGLISVYESSIEVEVTYDSGYDHDTITANEFASLAEAHSEFKTGRAFDVLTLDCVDTEITIIHPYSGAEGDIHYLNLVLNVEYNDVSVIITGDAEEEAELSMINNAAGYLPSEILQVGHHGSNTSSSRAFLKEVSLEVAIIQVGEDNPYGHPHDEVLIRLSDAGAEVYRNDLQGSIVITTDGQTYSIDEDPVEVEPDRVNINTADAEELERLHGIGPTLAGRIIEEREKELFDSLDDLIRVYGIGEDTVEGIKEQGLAYVE